MKTPCDALRPVGTREGTLRAGARTGSPKTTRGPFASSRPGSKPGTRHVNSQGLCLQEPGSAGTHVQRARAKSAILADGLTLQRQNPGRETRG